MKDFSHPNILTLKAVAIDRNQSPCIVMPFMWNGSLDIYLRKGEIRKNLLISTEEQLDSHLAVSILTDKMKEIFNKKYLSDHLLEN